MKTILIAFVTLAGAVCSAAELFNGKDLAGWTAVVDNDVTGGYAAKEPTWSVVNGAIRTTGTPFGYLRTKRADFADFTLSLEYRWWRKTEKPNSGVFLRLAAETGAFIPKCYENQLECNSVCSVFALGGSVLEGVAPRNPYDPANPLSGIAAAPAKATSSERPFGEWNVLEIEVRGDTIASRLNGVEMNRIKGVKNPKGAIALQSEGGAVEFRNIVVECIAKTTDKTSAGLEKRSHGYSSSRANAKPLITAHSGCMKTPQNSIASIKKGIECGADFIEVDLNFTDDGTPVLSHDRPKEVLYKNALDVLKANPKVEFNLDVKSTANLKEVIALAEEAGVADRIFFSGVKEEFVAEFKRQCPNAIFYYNVDVGRKTDVDKLIRRAKEIGAVGLNLNYRGASDKLVRKCHENGLLVSVWTVDRKDDIDRMKKLGVDCLATNNPVLAK